MDNATKISVSPAYQFAEAERIRKLEEQLAALATKPWAGWPETVAFFLYALALNVFISSLSLSGKDQMLLAAGLFAPTGALAARLYRSEKRLSLLIKLLSKDAFVRS